MKTVYDAPTQLAADITGRAAGMSMAACALLLCIFAFPKFLPDHLMSNTIKEPAATASESALEYMVERRTVAIADHARLYRIEADLATRIYDAALAAGIDPFLGYALVRVESAFRPHAVGPSGSLGLAQLQPATGLWLDPSIGEASLFDPDTNLRLGFSYLRMLIDRYGDARMALTAYKRGPGTVQQVLERGENPENGYANRVLRIKR